MITRSSAVRHLTTRELTRRIQKIDDGVLQHTAGLDALYELLYRSGELLFVDYRTNSSNEKALTVREEGVPDNASSMLMLVVEDAIRAFLGEDASSYANYSELNAAHRLTMVQEMQERYPEASDVRMIERKNLLLGLTQALNTTPHVHFFNVLSPWNMSAEFKANPEDMMRFIKPLTEVRVQQFQPTSFDVARLCLHQWGVLHDYVETLHEYYLQKMHESAESVFSVRSGFIYLIFMSLVVDAARAVERHYHDQPVSWVYAFVADFLPSADDVCEMLENLEEYVIAKPLPKVFFPKRENAF